MFYAFVIFLLFIGIMAFFIFANRPKMNVSAISTNKELHF